MSSKETKEKIKILEEHLQRCKEMLVNLSSPAPSLASSPALSRAPSPAPSISAPAPSLAPSISAPASSLAPSLASSPASSLLVAKPKGNYIKVNDILNITNMKKNEYNNLLVRKYTCIF